MSTYVCEHRLYDGYPQRVDPVVLFDLDRNRATMDLEYPMNNSKCHASASSISLVVKDGSKILPIISFLILWPVSFTVSFRYWPTFISGCVCRGLRYVFERLTSIVSV